MSDDTQQPSLPPTTPLPKVSPEASSTVSSNKQSETPASQLFLYSTTVSDVGTVRANNQDSSFAGEHLVAICDGMGGHAGGDTASTIAIRSLAHIERDDNSEDVSAIATMMETSVLAAHDAIVGKARRERKLSGMGTTVTAVALVADYWVLAHIGDSRAYLLRDGELTQITQDHSYVQHLINTGRITEQEAKNHPQRNVVMRVLGDFDIDPHPDVAMLKAHAADRWLLCSDGLCGVLEHSTIAETMIAFSDPNECVQHLVSMALKAGSTDNVTAVIADATLALDARAFDLPHQTPLVGGAASNTLEPIADIINEPVSTAPLLRDDDSPAQRAAALNQTVHPSGNDDEAPKVAQPSAVRDEAGELAAPDTGEIPVVQKTDGNISSDPNDPEVAEVIEQEQEAKRKSASKRRHRLRLAIIITFLVVLLAGAGAGYGAYRWSQTQYYVGESNGKVAIYQGVPTDIFGFQLSHEIEHTSISTADLPQNWQDELHQGITRDSLDEARSHVQLIRKELKSLEQASKTSASTTTSSKSSKTTTSSSSGNTSGSSASDSSDTSSSSNTEQNGGQQ